MNLNMLAKFISKGGSYAAGNRDTVREASPQDSGADICRGIRILESMNNHLHTPEKEQQNTNSNTKIMINADTTRLVDHHRFSYVISRLEIAFIIDHHAHKRSTVVLQTT